MCVLSFILLLFLHLTIYEQLKKIIFCEFLLFWMTTSFEVRSSHAEVFLGKGVLKICSKSIGEHPCQSVILIKFLCKAPQKNYFIPKFWKYYIVTFIAPFTEDVNLSQTETFVSWLHLSEFLHEIQTNVFKAHNLLWFNYMNRAQLYFSTATEWSAPKNYGPRKKLNAIS